ncbi:hypothetical protein [Streptomyces sp. NPDC016845]|uniref:hypothetical protein n=1 Tax=Streptomyces sp. NPDC016845 TaxID=3364972 RepID=UPI0037907BB0
MGWNSAHRIFDPVAKALIETGADDDTKRKVLGDLIGELQEGDWDTGDESLEDFLDDPAIVSAFADHNVHLHDKSCCARELGVGPREVLLLMRHEDTSEQQMAAAVDAYAHHLAERLRAHSAEDKLPTTEVVAWCANIIDPHPGQSRSW